MSSRVVVLRLPNCDFHWADEMAVPAMYDAKTKQGPWANLCQECYDKWGVGLGTGLGQKLIEGRICPTCKELVEINGDETLRRHKGKTEFDLATDGICSGSNCLVG